jgi:hypothetical protein
MFRIVLFLLPIAAICGAYLPQPGSLIICCPLICQKSMPKLGGTPVLPSACGNGPRRDNSEEGCLE